MRGQITLDTLITTAGLMAVSALLLTAFYGILTLTERGIRLGHLKYLSQVIEDRMSVCNNLEGVHIYAPYDVNVLCSQGKICWRDICTTVSCRGGGEGREFVLRNCSLSPYR